MVAIEYGMQMMEDTMTKGGGDNDFDFGVARRHFLLYHTSHEKLDSILGVVGYCSYIRNYIPCNHRDGTRLASRQARRVDANSRHSARAEVVLVTLAYPEMNSSSILSNLGPMPPAAQHSNNLQVAKQFCC
jgi:hypothetical protein